MWWLRSDQDLEGICESCQLVPGPDPPVPITTTKMPDGPWKIL